MMRRALLSPLLLALLVGGCTTPQKPAPAPPPPPPKPVAPPPAPVDWRDLAETKGAWRYLVDGTTTTARYEAAGTPLFTLSCDKATRRITLSRPDVAVGTPLKVTSSYGSRMLTTPNLAANDTLLDQIAFSRGRFTIEAAGVPELVLPAWAEPGRVIEDCRG